jgi:GntR family transcriptional regulator
VTFEWNDNQPIYKQLRDLVVERIMDGSFAEGEAVPSVRQVATDYQINHLTVGKAYQELVDAGLLEKRRGLGMFVMDGARAALTDNEHQRFFD